ncbi:MAG: long-chain fatty acid--CoA ligase [Planctomycetota bacterium]|nr:MAG: long-chain fatty acid--CoA ligase [Planctomycetota bacterium]
MGPRPALLFKRHGVFRSLDWSTYRRLADRLAAALIALRVEPGDCVALFSPNSVHWLVFDHGTLSAAAVTVPLHASLTAPQAAFQIRHSGAVVVWVAGREQAEKLAAVSDSLPELRAVVTGHRDFPDSWFRCPVHTFDELVHRGRVVLDRQPRLVEEREASIGSETLATIIYTSGTTGEPKGVMLTHGNLLSNAVATASIAGLSGEDLLLSWLPYSHIYARTVDHYLTTCVGMTVALAEGVDTVVSDARIVRPTWLTAVPRFYEKLWSAVEELEPSARGRTLRRLLGGRIRQLTSGGAPLPRYVAEGFQAAGIPLLEGYGLTESSPVIAFNSPDACRVGTVGRPLPGVEVRIAEDGEILVRGPNVMRGYWKNPAATAEALADGWLHTGDVGELDADGFLTITDRKKDLIVTSSGKNVAPAMLERLLTADPWIDQAVVYGDGRSFLTALIVPDWNAVMQELQVAEKPDPDELGVVRDRRVVDALQRRVEDRMQSVSRPERVRRIAVLAEPFSVDRDEVTPTLKLRRRHIFQRYQEVLRELYAMPPDSRQQGNSVE